MIYHRDGGQVVDVSTGRFFETDETRQEKEQASDGTPAPFMRQLNTQHTTAATDLPLMHAAILCWECVGRQGKKATA